MHTYQKGMSYTAVTLCCFLFASCGRETNNTIQINWESNKVYQWKDYFNEDQYPDAYPFEADTELKMTLADFPDTIFIWREFSILASVNGEEYALASGMPIWNAFFTDLNSDGFPELCTTVSYGSGIVDNHIVVFDYHNDKAYSLWERMQYDYALYIENGELFVQKSLPFSSENETPESITGKLLIENDTLLFQQV